jgi:TolB-like protein
MQIWSAEIKELQVLYTSLKGRFPELEKDLEHLIKTDDENVALLYSRRCLEIIVTDLCECELKRPRKTEPLKGIIDKLHREEKVPSHIITSMDHLNSLSTYGTHPKDFDPEQVKPVLNNLAIIIKWYIKYKDAKIISKQGAEELKDVIKAPAPDDSAKPIQKSKKRLIFLLSGTLLVVAIVVVALFVFNIIGGKKETREIEKSIAVLPFKLLSDEPEKQYLADGMMDAILLHLSKIEDLRVMSRTSTEQYKESGKTMTEIGKELGVAYLLEGSFQKFGDDVRLIVQLIQAGKEGHVWANKYDRKWNDIFSVQSEVAQAIASEVNVEITPEEKQLIEKTPTTSLTAYDFFQRGREEYWKGEIEKAEDFYKKALVYDSTFAQAYTGLAWVYWDKHFWGTILSDDFMDSVLIFCDIALSYDDHLSEAYNIRGLYYDAAGEPEQAVKEIDKALALNPNDWMAYYIKGNIYMWVLEDFVISIKNLHEAVSRNRGEGLPDLLGSLARAYLDIGFVDKARHYYREAFSLDMDSLLYFRRSAWLEFSVGNFEKVVEFMEEARKIDSTDLWADYLYTFAGKHLEAYVNYTKLIERRKESGVLSLDISHRIGYAFWKMGKYKEAENYFNQQIRYGTEMIKLGRQSSSRMAAQYDLAGVYAFRGEKEIAYRYLDEVNKKKIFPLWWVTMFKHDPLFDSIREEERFQAILRDVEAKYQAEHERVRKWLEEQGML